MGEFRANRCELRYFRMADRWVIEATPGTERGIDGSILWEGDHEPTHMERMWVWQAVNYGIRLAMRGAECFTRRGRLTRERPGTPLPLPAAGPPKKGARREDDCIAIGRSLFFSLQRGST